MTTAEEETKVAPEGAETDAEGIKERGMGLEQTTKRGLHTGTPAYEQFSVAMRNLIKDSLLPVDATDADLYYLLEMAATYRLDPFARELWAVKMPGRNAGQGGYLTIMVGRDGMLAIAERHHDFRGYRCQAYYSNDTLNYHDVPTEKPDGTWSHVEHSFAINGDRGELMGAWAEVYREGRPPVFFDAHLEEYDKSDNDYSPWRKQKTVMIEKCALVTALRHAFRISGLYIADEMSNAMLAPKAEVARAEEGAFNWGEDEAVKNRLADLFAALGPARWSPAKQRITLSPLKTDDERRALIAQLVAECEGADVPVPPIRDVDEVVVTEDEVEVVPDDDEPGASS